MRCHCDTNNRAPRWTFTDPCKTRGETRCPGGDQYFRFLVPLSSDNEVRSLIIANIPINCTGKNAPILSYSDLDLQKSFCLEVFLL